MSINKNMLNEAAKAQGADFADVPEVDVSGINNAMNSGLGKQEQTARQNFKNAVRETYHVIAKTRALSQAWACSYEAAYGKKPEDSLVADLFGELMTEGPNPEF